MQKDSKICSDQFNEMCCKCTTRKKLFRQSVKLAYGSLSNWRPEDSFPTSIQLGHDHVLSLIGARLSREIDDVWFVDVFVELIEQEILRKNHFGG